MRMAHRKTYHDATNRSLTFAQLGPNGAGERVQCSIFSPGPVKDEEVIWRLVTSPMHVSSKKPYPLPTIVSHMFSKGASIQRESHSTPTEVIRSIETILSYSEKARWIGYVRAAAGDLRAARNAEGRPVLSIYDTADSFNCGHGELGIYEAIPEADERELASEVLRRLGPIRPRSELMGGKVWDKLAPEYRDRPLEEKLQVLADGATGRA